MLPRRTQKMCAPCPAPKTSVPSLIKRPYTVDSLRLVSFAHRERTNDRFPSTQINVRCKRCDSPPCTKSASTKHAVLLCHSMKKRNGEKRTKRTEIPLFLPLFHPFSAVFGLVFANNN